MSIKGAKYELEETDFHYLPALVSNEFLGVQLVEVSFTKGILLVMQTRDEPGALHFF
ncbi:MAG: hypothetical protein LBD38_01980 [Streptococcaceae bacterium]|nr:hypothetical protein [Streptococcaceae bacterium]